MSDNDPERKHVVPVQPIYISQENCEPTFGLNPRRYREIIREEGLAVVELGKLRLVRAADLAQCLAAKAVKKANALPESNTERLRRLAGLGRAGGAK